ncbi:MAG: hypothetical protein AAFO91_07465, partial [Bacteroidota bacterium]
LINRPLTQTLSQIGNAFKGIGDEIQREIRLARQLSQAFRENNRELAVLEARRAFADRQIRALKFTIDDVTASYGLRIAANRQALEIETEINADEVRLAEDQLALTLGDLTRSGSQEINENLIPSFFREEFLEQARVRVEAVRRETRLLISELENENLDFEGARSFLQGRGLQSDDAAVERFLQSFTRLQEVQQRSFEVQTEYNNTLNSINAEAVDRLREAQERLLSAQLAVRDALRDSDNLEGEAAINRRRELALEQIQILEDETRAAFRAANEQFNLENDFIELRRRANEQADTELTEFRFEQQRERINNESQALTQELELLEQSANDTLTLEEFKAQEQLRIRIDALQQLRQVAVDQFGADSDEVLNIDVQLAQANREGTGLNESAQARIRQGLLETADLRRQVGLAEVELIQEVADKTIDVEKFKQAQRLGLEIEFLQEKRRILATDPDANPEELGLIDLQIQNLENQITDLGNLNLGPLQRIKNAIQDTFNLDDATFQTLSQQVGGILSNLSAGISASFDRQISEYD